MKEKSTQEKLLDAFDKSEKKTISDICQIAGVRRLTFYYQYKTNADFRREYVKREIAEKLKEI